MNPQDLLYTNQFVATNELDFDRNKLTRDRINVLKTIDRPFPKNYNRNWDPVISDEVRDIVKDRYKKYKTTAVLLDSRDRNCDVYPLPNNYKVILGTQFNYIESIKLLNVNLNNLFLTKTQISWLFPPNIGGEFSTEIPCGIYSNKDLAQIMIDYMSMIPDHDGNIQNIFVDINPSLNEIKIINRCNVPTIFALQTLLKPTDDTFGTIDITENIGIYIVTKYQFTNMELPLIPTGITTNIGGFSKKLFNCVPFWNGNSTGNEYKFIDNIMIDDIIFYRYLLIPRPDGQELITNTSQNIILSATISRFLKSINRSNYIGTFDNKNINCLPIIGEAKEFGIDFENSPLMEIFGWNECEENFGYVLTNKSSLNKNKDKCFNIFRDPCCSCTNGNDCNWIFKIEPYILLKLSAPSYPEDTIAGNLVKSQNLPRIINNTEDNEDVINIFAKICLNNQGEYQIETSILKYYETPLEKLDELVVTFVDRNGCILDLKCNNTIILEITEAVDVLKDTLIDSRHGEANITGIRH